MLSSFSKKNIVLSTAVVISLGLTGCGGGGGSSSGTTTPTKTGVFADAPVEGLSYKTATQSGFTDAQGHFKYKDGETVEFKLGTLSLGKGKAGALVTPYTISDKNTTATNIAMVLQNFDANRSNTQVLNLSELKDFNFSADENTRDINLSDAPSNLQNKLATVLATSSFQKHVDKSNHDLIPETEVKKNMDDYIQQFKEKQKEEVIKQTVDDSSKASGGYAEGNIIPFTESSTNKSQEGVTYTEKLGATGNLKATKITQGSYSGLELHLKDGISSMEITEATETEKILGNTASIGKFSGMITSDFKAGTEHIVVSSSKFGSADCVNNYNTILPFKITLENTDLSDLYFDSENMISTTCPSWVNEDSPEDEEPQNFKDTENYILKDSNGIVTKVSRFSQMER